MHLTSCDSMGVCMTLDSMLDAAFNLSVDAHGDEIESRDNSLDFFFVPCVLGIPC